MDRKEFEEKYQELTKYLDLCRTDILEEKRRSDPIVVDANQDYSRDITRLDANWSTVPKGQYDPEAHKSDREALLDKKETIENDSMREGYRKIKEESLDNWFAGSPDLRKEASARIEKDPRYEWLKEQDPQPGMEQNQDQSRINNDFTQEAGSNIPPIKQDFEERKGETKGELPGYRAEEQQDKLAKAILDTDKFPGYGHPDVPESESEVPATKMTPDSFPGYDTQFTVEHDVQPEAGIHYTPPKPPPKDGPDME